MIFTRLRFQPFRFRQLQFRSASDLKIPHSPSSSVDSSLLRICTILYQQQNSPDSKLFVSLRNAGFELTHELFLQVCNRFPCSWKPVHRLYTFSLSHSQFVHSPITHNKILDIYGKSRNTQVFWDFLRETAEKRLVSPTTLRIAARSLAAAKEMKKCVEFFREAHAQDLFDGVETLNFVVESLCDRKLVGEARYLVSKLKETVIQPSARTYGTLVAGFCEGGDLLGACKVWNLVMEEGIEPEIASYNQMIQAFFKCDRILDAMKMFRCLKSERFADMCPSSYSLLVRWMCRKGKLLDALMVFDEMLKRGMEADDQNQVFASLIYAIVSAGGVREGHKILRGMKTPNVNVYHGLMKGLLRRRRAAEATQVFRDMAERGCEPTMHTYIMLLQGHLGRRGRKGPHPAVNFESIFVGGLVLKSGKRPLEATKYVQGIVGHKGRGGDLPRFDYNRFLHWFSDEEGVLMFGEMGKRLREVGLNDLADILERYGKKMATRERRRTRWTDDDNKESLHMMG